MYHYAGPSPTDFIAMVYEFEYLCSPSGVLIKYSKNFEREKNYFDLPYDKNYPLRKNEAQNEFEYIPNDYYSFGILYNAQKK